MEVSSGGYQTLGTFYSDHCPMLLRLDATVVERLGRQTILIPSSLDDA